MSQRKLKPVTKIIPVMTDITIDRLLWSLAVVLVATILIFSAMVYGSL